MPNCKLNQHLFNIYKMYFYPHSIMRFGNGVTAIVK